MSRADASSISGAGLGAKHDPQKERVPPPPPPTMVTFPINICTRTPNPPWSEASNPRLFQRLSRLRRPSDVGTDILEALNISLFPATDFENLIPSAEKYIPPLSWLDPPEGWNEHSRPSGPKKVPEGSILPTQILSNTKPAPDREDFYSRVKELQYENLDAFAALSRTAKPNSPRVRLAQFRRFWDGLDNMAYYWDTSLDDYIPKKLASVKLDSAESSDRPTAGTDNESCEMDVSMPRKRAKTTPTPPPESTLETIESPNPDSKSTENKDASQDSDAPSRDETSSGSYKGMRIGTGTAMPELFRVDTVRAFVETVVWNFGCCIANHRRPPHLAVERLVLPVKITSAVWSNPPDRQRTRAGWLEGPVLGIQCRDQVGFKMGGEDAEKQASLDLLREIGGLLALAQERAREGKRERKPGKGMWWTKVPRWGGGPGGEIGNEAGNTDEAGVEEKEPELKSRCKDVPKDKQSDGSARRKQLGVEAWKKLKPGTGYWDPKVDYRAVGKERDDDLDNVSNLHPGRMHSVT